MALRDYAVEQQLNYEGVNWEFRQNIPLDKICGDLRKKCNPRVDLAVDVDVKNVNRLTAVLERGDELTAGTLWLRPDGEYEEVDYHHRIAACRKAKVKSIDAYVILCSKDRIESLAGYQLATLGQTEDDAAVWAYQYMQKEKVTRKEAARVYTISEYALENYAQAMNVLDRIKDRIGRDEINATPNIRNVLKELAGIPNDKFLADAVRLAMNYRKLRGESLVNLREALKDAIRTGGDPAAEKVISHWQSIWREKSAPPKPGKNARKNKRGQGFDSILRAANMFFSLLNKEQTVPSFSVPELEVIIEKFTSWDVLYNDAAQYFKKRLESWQFVNTTKHQRASNRQQKHSSKNARI